MSVDIDTMLADAARGRRLAYYPSCGFDTRWIFDEYDLFVFSDRSAESPQSRRNFWTRFKAALGVPVNLRASTVKSRVFEFSGKTGFLFFQDNNEVLTRVRNCGCKLSCLVGVCDGCCEGGNDECLNDLATSRFLPQAFGMIHQDGMEYITDHSPLLRGCEGYMEFILGRQRFVRLDASASRTRSAGGSPHSRAYGGYGEVRRLRVHRHAPVVQEWGNKRIRATVEHDSIANHFHELDGVVISNTCHRFCERQQNQGMAAAKLEIRGFCYFHPSAPRGWSAAKSFRHLLEKSEKRGWNVVGAIAFGEGDHAEFPDILARWDAPHPKWIRLFHFDSDDFPLLKANAVPA